jgi:hypothetical protein
VEYFEDTSRIPFLHPSIPHLTMRLKSLKATFALSLLGYVLAALAIPTDSFSVEEAVVKRDASKYVFAHFMVRGTSILISKFFHS